MAIVWTTFFAKKHRHEEIVACDIDPELEKIVRHTPETLDHYPLTLQIKILRFLTHSRYLDAKHLGNNSYGNLAPFSVRGSRNKHIF